MAGASKPNASMFEAPFTRISGSLKSGDGSALFDGNLDVTGSYNYGYFNKAADHVILESSAPFRVWAFPNSSYPTYNAALAITRLAADGITWIAVDGALPRSNHAGVWAVTTPNLVSGRYKFAYASGYRIDNEWFLEMLADTKTVVEAADGTLYGVSGTGFVSVGTAPCTEALLDASGASPGMLDAVTSSAWAGLPAGQLVLHHKATASVVAVTGTIVAKPRIVKQVKDYAMTDWSSVTGISLTVQESGGGVVRAAVSVDGGVTWRTWKNAAWSILDVDDVSAFTTDGMTAAVLGARTAADWATLFPAGAFGLRFAYLLDRVTLSGVAAVDTLTVSGSVNGAWVQDYGAKVGWLEGGARVQITAAGSYKINWPVL